MLCYLTMHSADVNKNLRYTVDWACPTSIDEYDSLIWCYRSSYETADRSRNKAVEQHSGQQSYMSFEINDRQKLHTLCTLYARYIGRARQSVTCAPDEILLCRRHPSHFDRFARRD